MTDSIEYLDASAILNPKNQNKPYPSIVILDDVIESGVCDKLISEATDFHPAALYRGNEEEQYDQSERNNQTMWGKEDWVYKLVEPHLTHAIEFAGWDFEISQAEPYQIAKYQVGEFHNWHQDGLGPLRKGEPQTRKITMSLQLNDDYEGGELELFPHEPMKFTRGTMVFFPSFQPHQVHPVTKGTRYSLVVWYIGNPWR